MISATKWVRDRAQRISDTIIKDIPTPKPSEEQVAAARSRRQRMHALEEAREIKRATEFL